MTTQSIINQDITNLDSNINNQEIQYHIKEINATLYNHQKDFDKIKKQLQQKANELAITQCDFILSGEIEIDPLLLRLLVKKNQKKKPTIQQTNVLKRSARDLGKKFNHISQAINFLYEQLKFQDKKIQSIETDIPYKLNEGMKYLEKKINDLTQQQNIQTQNIKQRLQMKHIQSLQKIKQLQKRMMTQITDTKTLVNTKTNAQFVKESISQFEEKIFKKLRQYQVESTVDPQRVFKIQSKLNKIEIDYHTSNVEQGFKFKTLMEKIQTQLVKKNQYTDNNISLERRLSLINTNLADLSKRIIHIQNTQKEVNNIVKMTTQTTHVIQKQVKRAMDILKNLKIGEQFERMMASLDPDKIIQLDRRIQYLESDGKQYEEQIKNLQKEIEKLRMKSNTNGINVQNNSHKSKRQQIEEIVMDYLNNNFFMKKLSFVESQVADTKINHDLLISMERKLIKLQKQSEVHNFMYQMKGLEEYIKKQVLILTSKFSQLQSELKQDIKKQSRAIRSIDRSRSNSSVNFKKLQLINYMGNTNNQGMFSNDLLNDNAFSKGKALTALMNSRQK